MTEIPPDEREESRTPELPDLTVEIEAMSHIAKTLAPLSRQSIARVLQWANGVYSIQAPSVLPARSPREATHARIPELEGGTNLVGDPASLFAKATPATQPDKALVMAYWLQEREGNPEFDSQTLNSKLTHLGHKIGNITRALGSLSAMRPQLVVQTRKEGKTKQARKRYKLTVEGVRRVERLLAGGTEED